jgi:hypothetical protein
MFQKLSLLPSSGTDVVNKKRNGPKKAGLTLGVCVSANMSESMHQSLMIKAETANRTLVFILYHRE